MRVENDMQEISRWTFWVRVNEEDRRVWGGGERSETGSLC
jgi:hypothetical protein